MFKKINWQYAIGEIIIVIIGITIAFTLNKWGENAKDRVAKQQYLTSLMVDLDNEIEHLKENIARFQGKKSDIEAIFPYLYGRQEGRDSISRKIFDLAGVINFHPNDVTYKTLINSGDLSLFEDFELKKALENHYSDHTLIEQDYQRQHHINEAYFADLMIYNIDYDKLRRGDYSFMDDPLLKSIVQSLYGTYGIAIESSQKGIARCEALKAVLHEAQKP